ncbi:MAG TPA: peptide ABC transporter substrate-binding protein [Verrucomicrobiae bacterium]|jgi:oligopeptide transport system substrate-binding protein|nr:peptide ABC transporter substrate-binding protein [Verrucomicrobiae bacterium]
MTWRHRRWEGAKPPRHVGAGAFFLAALLLVAGCSAREPQADLVIVNGPNPQTLDPALATGLEDLRIISALFEGLTRPDPHTAGATPGLAERWEISPDGCVYTFHLRDHLQWSEGVPLTADDVVYSWRRALDPKTAAEYAGQLFYLKNGEAFATGKLKDFSQVGVRALDERTVRVELNQPTAFFLDLCAFQTLAVVPRQVIDKDPDHWLREKNLPTSGPYVIEEWRLNDKIRVRKNPFYWDASNTKSATIDFLPVSVPSTALNLYETGVADIIWDRDYLPNELLDILEKRPDFHTFPYLGSYFLRVNTTKPPFNDPRVRQALAMAIDKEHLTRKILRGGETPATHLVPDGTAHYERAEGLGYDPAAARKLLAAAGFPGGKGFPVAEYLIDTAGNLHAKIASEIQSMWEEQLGVHIQLRQMEKQAYLAAQNSLNYDISRSMWVGDYNDPNTFLDLFLSDSGNNRTGWKNAAYDKLMHEANRQTDLKRRADLLRQAETILVHDELPIIPIYFYVGLNYFNPDKVKGIYPNILDQHPFNVIYRVARGK